MTTDGQEIDFTKGETPQELVEAFQRRFYIDNNAKVEYHLFRVIASKGPAQPVPAQIPIAATGDREEAYKMAEQYRGNASIIIQRREWLLPKEKKGRTVWVNACTADVQGDEA